MSRKSQNQFQSIVLAMLIGVALSRPAEAQTALTPAQLTERAIERRAIEAVNWGMPAVKFDRMVQAMLEAKGGFNQIIYWSGFSDWGFGKFEHHRELSPIDAQTIIRMNRDTLYSAAVFDLDAGPVTITFRTACRS